MEPLTARTTWEAFVTAATVRARPVVVGPAPLATMASRTRVRRESTVVAPVLRAMVVEAMGWIADALNMNVEPSSAITLAAAAQLREELAGCRVALILSGGNIDPKALEPPLRESQVSLISREPAAR